MTAVPDECVDLVVTSPPYPMIQLWDDLFSKTSADIPRALERYEAQQAFELMHQQLDATWTQLRRVLRPGAIACINIGDATRSINGQFRMFANHARVTSKFLSLGFMQLPSILWRKPTNAPNKFMGSGMLPPSAYVTLEHEYILVFRKGGKREFNTKIQKQARRESAYFWEERNVWFSDVWMDLRGAPQALPATQNRKRSGAFPLELPYRLIHMFSILGDTVLDPFLGTGTTVQAAMCSGRSSLGFEIESAFQPLILEKIASVPEIANAIIHQRLNAHQNFVRDCINSNKSLKHHNLHYDFPVMTRHEENLWLNPIKHVHYQSAQKAKVIYAARDQIVSKLDHDGTNGGIPPQTSRAKVKGRQLKLF